MCLIIFDTRDSKERFDLDVFKRAYELNPDGIGVMWALHGTLRTFRTLDDVPGAWDRYANARQRQLPVAVHFRAGTVGDRLLSNVHPFDIVPGKLAVMHNGTLGGAVQAQRVGTQTDSECLVEGLLKKLPVNFLNEPLMRAAVNAIGADSRLFFMDGYGNYDIVTNYRWTVWDYEEPGKGVWFSKDADLGYVLDGDRSLKFYTKKYKKPYVPPSPSSFYGPTYSEGGWDDDDADWAGHYAHLRPVKQAKPTKPNKYERLWTDHVAGTLVFDYGFFTGFADEDMRFRRYATGFVENASLWAIENEEKNEVPALILNIKDMASHGILYQIPDREASGVFQQLDSLHQCKYGDAVHSRYYRQVVDVHLHNGKTVQAWVYKLATTLSSVGHSAPVPYGDWSVWAERQALLKATQEEAS